MNTVQKNTIMRPSMTVVALVLLFMAGSSVTELPADTGTADWLLIAAMAIIGAVSGFIAWMLED